VYEIARRSGAAVLLQEGHHSGELWGLTTHPTDPDVYATAGDGASLRHFTLYYCSLLKCAAAAITVNGSAVVAAAYDTVLCMHGLCHVSADVSRMR
jgi:hypothetical protein